MKTSKHFTDSPAVPLHSSAQGSRELIKRDGYEEFKRRVDNGRYEFAGYDECGEGTFVDKEST